MNVTVSQHIYSHVPKDLSPSNRRGFQTLCYTKSDLSLEEVSILEDRAQYYASDSEGVKFQFHMLPGRKAVVSRIVPLAEPDEFGRKGRYLSHSLILSSVDFEALDYCPLSLFAVKWFYNRLEDISHNSGDIPRKVVEIADYWEDKALTEARAWEPSQLEKLARLGWQAEFLRKEHQTVGLTGKLEGMFNVLAIIFLFTAPEKRPSLTFDTYAYGCDWSRDWPFWVWGNSDQISTGDPRQIFSDYRQVQTDLSSDKDSLYESWITTRAMPEKLEHFIDQRDDALLLERAIQGDQQAITLSQNIDDKFAQDIIQMNSLVIANRFIDQIPWELSPQTITMIKTNVETYPFEYYKMLGSGMTPEELSQYFYNLILINIQTPIPKKDRKLLSKLAKETNNAGLAGLIRLEAGDLAGWRKSFDSLTEEEYQQQLRLILSSGKISAKDALYPKYLHVWAIESGPSLKTGEIKSILAMLNKQSESFKADSLLKLAPLLKGDDRKHLAKWTRSYTGSAPQLKSYFQSNEQTTGSAFGRFKSRFSRGSSPSKKSQKR